MEEVCKPCHRSQSASPEASPLSDISCIWEDCNWPAAAAAAPSSHIAECGFSNSDDLGYFLIAATGNNESNPVLSSDQLLLDSLISSPHNDHIASETQVSKDFVAEAPYLLQLAPSVDQMQLLEAMYSAPINPTTLHPYEAAGMVFRLDPCSFEVMETNAFPFPLVNSQSKVAPSFFELPSLQIKSVAAPKRESHDSGSSSGDDSSPSSARSGVFNPASAAPAQQDRSTKLEAENSQGTKRLRLDGNLWQSTSPYEAKPFTQNTNITELLPIGPALNTNGKPRAKRGSATDPQSVYARHRREKINERLKTLQHLVPNGAKVDIVTMLEEAIHYVKFLQLQVRLLSSDEYWIYAPTSYNGPEMSLGIEMPSMA